MRLFPYPDYRRIVLAVILGLNTSTAFAQNSDEIGFATVLDQPFYSVTASVPTLQTESIDDRDNTGYEIDFLVSPSGEIAGLNAYNLTEGQRTQMCSPIPVQLVGPPPRTIYLIPIGCGGRGGGGTLSQDTLVVEFSDDGDNLTDAAPLTLDVSVQEILDGVTGVPMKIPVTLPNAVNK